jgi:WD40-like Beta Propeller Repeat
MCVMRVRTYLYILIIAVLLGACLFSGKKAVPTAEPILSTTLEQSLATDTPAPPSPSPTRIPSSTPTLTRKQARQTQQAQTSTPTLAIPTATSTPSLPSEDILVYRPFEIITSTIPAEVKPGGSLLLTGEQPQILHFAPQAHADALEGIGTACLSASPDGQWIASCPLAYDSPTGRWLMVDSNAGQHFQVAMDIYLISFGYYEWLDNQRMIFPQVQEADPFNPMVVIDPFSGEQSTLASEYPGIVGSYTGSAGTMGFAYSDVVYESSLNLVIYPEERTSGKFITLWNRLTNTILGEVEDKGKFLHYPLWSPDEMQFVVAARQQAAGGNYVEEWFSVSRAGQVKQLTRFGEYFRSVKIGAGARWSPDGQKLAFWLRTTPDLCQDANLAVLDMTSLQVTETCIPGTLGYSRPPVWSLDSRYIGAVYATESTWQAFLVDFAQGRAYDITGYGAPVGWLAAP